MFAAPPVINNGLSNSGFSNRGFSNGSFRQASLGHKNIRIEKRLNQIERELYATDLKLDKLNFEKKSLIKRSQYSRNRFGIKQELSNINYEIAVLKDCKAELKYEAANLEKKLYY